jgi:hypothetical protein
VPRGRADNLLAQLREHLVDALDRCPTRPNLQQCRQTFQAPGLTLSTSNQRMADSTPWTTTRSSSTSRTSCPVPTSVRRTGGPACRIGVSLGGFPSSRPRPTLRTPQPGKFGRDGQAIDVLRPRQSRTPISPLRRVLSLDSAVFLSRCPPANLRSEHARQHMGNHRSPVSPVPRTLDEPAGSFGTDPLSNGLGGRRRGSGIGCQLRMQLRQPLRDSIHVNQPNRLARSGRTAD